MSLQYLGGKSRIAKHLASVIDEYRAPGRWVWDAFCGGLSMSVALSQKGPVLASDANAALIACYAAVRAGWDPPTVVSREDHARARYLPDTDPRKALIGIGSSFGGSWFESYAAGQNGPLTYAQLAARNVKNAAPVPAAVMHMSFFDLGVSPEPVLYLDPPYQGTAGYKATGPFDHKAFQRRVSEWAEQVPVFVSEYSLPLGREIWARTSRGTFGVKSGKVHTERLYLVGNW